MKNLFIVGARGFGREVYNLFLDCKGNLEDVECKGFLDDNSSALDGFKGYPPIVSSVENYEPQENDLFIVALGDPHAKRKYVEMVKGKGGKFLTLVHPTAMISTNSTLGEGCLVFPNAIISCDITIEDFVTVNAYCVMGHDVYVESYSHLGSVSTFGGFAHIGKEVTMHPKVHISPHVKVGDNAILGAGSVIIRKVPDGVTVYGNPAKKLKF